MTDQIIINDPNHDPREHFIDVLINGEMKHISEWDWHRFKEANFKAPMNSAEMELYGIPPRYRKGNRESILPEDRQFVLDYIEQWKVGPERCPAPHGLVLWDDVDPSRAALYGSLIIQRLHTRKKTVFCVTAADLEMYLGDEENYKRFSKTIECLLILDFPAEPKRYGANIDSFTARVMLARYNNLNPTIIISSLNQNEMHSKLIKYERKDFLNSIYNYTRFRKIKAPGPREAQ